MSIVKRTVLSLLALGFVVAASASAQQPATAGEYPGLETGKMWTFDVPPLEYWAQRYNFRPSQAWLDHARLSAARIGGCTASFVSADGLVMTNNHCARGCVTNVSQPGEDLLGNGFYATTRAQERVCPGGFVEQLREIADVTDQVTAAVPAGTPANRAADLRAEAIRGIEQRCRGTQADLNCQVVTMYRGGQYKLYKFRRFTDVRLVFAPEVSVAFWGGDPDNFTYPRHDLDVTFYRVYVNGAPAQMDHFFRWSRNGSREGDLVFVVGNPGSTGRLNTLSVLEYLREVQYPATLDAFARQIVVYQALGQMAPERLTALRNTLFGIQNSQKATQGYLAGLVDPQLMARKTAWERDFRNRVTANPELRQRYGLAWDNIARIRGQMRGVDVRRRYHAFGAYGTRLLGFAGTITRYATEMAKADSARLMPFRDAMRPRMEQGLYGATPIDTAQEIRLLTAYFTAMARELPATDAVRRQALGTSTPEEAARAMVRASQILTADQRRTLVQGGAAAIAASADPFVALARVIDPLERAIATQWTAWTNEEAQNDELIARALLAVFGNTVAPDATFSLRISDGEVLRYPSNGSLAQPYTTFYGLYDRAYGFNLQEPWNLTPRWLAARSRLDLATPFNAVSTNDIIGGNSGSPVISRDGEVVGLIFDGNIEAQPMRFLFSEAVGRSVWVDSRGLIEALRRVYDADALANELTRDN
jgi:hypothetical protein